MLRVYIKNIIHKILRIYIYVSKRRVKETHDRFFLSALLFLSFAFSFFVWFLFLVLLFCFSSFLACCKNY